MYGLYFNMCVHLARYGSDGYFLFNSHWNCCMELVSWIVDKSGLHLCYDMREELIIQCYPVVVLCI